MAHSSGASVARQILCKTFAWSTIAFCAVVTIVSPANAAPPRKRPVAALRPPAASDHPPAGSYVRRLGVIPPVRQLALPAWTKSKMGFAAMEPTTEPSIRGISLGGFGAGSFQINQSGTFGPWTFGSHELRILPQAAFHVRIQPQGQAATIRTLALDGPLGHLPASWPKIDPGQATYSGMYPFGWIDYGGLGADVSLKFWSPIVAGDDHRTSMPVAYFDVRLKNTSSVATKVSVMFTFPNAPVHVAAAAKRNWMTGKPMFVPSSVRSGLLSRFEQDGGIKAITLAASDPANTIDAQDTAWTIAVSPKPGQDVTWTTSWRGEADGADVIGAFGRSGTLPDAPLDGSHSAGALAVSVELRPGEATVVSFVLAWDVPREVYAVAPHAAEAANTFSPAKAAIKGGTTVWLKRYTEFLGARTDERNNYIKGSYKPLQSFGIADQSLRDHDAAQRAVEAWWAPLAVNTSVPIWLRGAALNQTAYLTSGHSFWALGLESDTVGSPDGLRIGTAVAGTHPFFVDTGAEGADESANNGDVGPYAYLVTSKLFPSIERDIIVTQGELLKRSRDAQLHNLGSTDGGSPFVLWDNKGGNYHIDRTILFAARWWRFVQDRHDDTLFQWLYPTMVRILQQHRANFFREGSRLPFDPPFQANTHDMLGVSGHGVYNSALWIFFEDLMAAAADKAGKDGLVVPVGLTGADLRADAVAARQEFETAFWDDQRGYYRFDTGNSSPYSQGIFAEGLYAEHLAAALHLPPIVRSDRLRRHLWSVDRILVEPFRLRDGTSVGAANLADATGKLYGGLDIGDKPLGEAPDGREVWPGSIYPMAALMMTQGARSNDKGLSLKGLDIGRGMSAIIWSRPDLGYAYIAPEAWAAENPAIHRNPDYLRPLSVWDLYDRISPLPTVAMSNPSKTAAAGASRRVGR